MSEQRAVPRLTRDERMRAEGAMNALDVAGERIAALTAERDSAKRELAEIEADAEAERKKYEALREERDALKQQLADEELVFNHANELVGKYEADANALTAENAALKATVERLDWQPITPENLPKVGDEVVSGTSILVIDSEGYFTDLTYRGWKKEHYTHFRPINAPILAARTTPPAKEPK